MAEHMPPVDLFGSHAALKGVGLSDRRSATILFCDIVNSTHLIAPQDPEDARELLAGAIDMMIRHVTRYGGTLCQTLGDGVYAIFGAPAAQENHAARACFAADAMLREVGRDHQIALRLGLCSGEVLWDGAAMQARIGAPVIGRAVNAAAKLLQSAVPNSIRIADSTAALAGDWVDVKAVEPVDLTPTDRLSAFQVMGIRRRRLQASDASPMVGRDRLRRTLSDALSVLTGRMPVSGSGVVPALHMVTGEAGLGKSKLMALLAADARWRGVRVVEWAVPAIMPLDAPSLLHELTAELLDGPLPATREETLALIMAAGASDQGAQSLSLLLHNDANAARPKAGENRLVLAAGAIADIAAAGARTRPLLLLVEDLHWAGTEVLTVLSALLPRMVGHPVMLLASSREEVLPPALDIGLAVKRHRLAPLTSEEAGALLDSRMGMDPALAPVKADLLRRAQGNPFFLVECVRVLQDQGVVTGSPGAMRLGVPARGHLPDTVQALLAARTDVLRDPLRDTLRAAAVIGPTFDAALLAGLIGQSVQTLPLGGLAAAGMIDETRLLPRLEYSFHHALLHEAVYEGITRRDRQRLHTRLVDLLDMADFASLPGRRAAQARHAGQAQLWPVALAAGREAGMESLRRSLAAEAVSLFALAINANDRMPAGSEKHRAGVDLRLTLARAAMPAGLHARAMEALDDAILLARQAGDDESALAGLVQQISYEWVYGDLRHAVALSQQALTLSQHVGASAPHPEVMILAACCLLEHGQLAASLSLLERAGEERAWENHTPGRFLMVDSAMVTAIMRARCLSYMDRPAEADTFVMHALHLADTGHYPFNRIFARTYAAEVKVRLGHYNEAFTLSRQGLALSGAAGSPLLDNPLQVRRGLAMINLGQGVEGLAEIERAEVGTTRRNARLHMVWARYGRILALARIGLTTQALSERTALADILEKGGYGLLALILPTEEQVRAGSPLPAGA
ncbi:ATP-binding protein [Niveispirillum irakense]|uniref:ATP-binding protein n=1 Tax=Niveispirillum irakense TaxID=34011 RepID=UPI00041E73A8|nr:adenylate/guanylate cyclase domain-containing protein [Niveispirillum irakense]